MLGFIVYLLVYLFTCSLVYLFTCLLLLVYLFTFTCLLLLVHFYLFTWLLVHLFTCLLVLFTCLFSFNPCAPEASELNQLRFPEHIWWEFQKQIKTYILSQFIGLQKTV